MVTMMCQWILLEHFFSNIARLSLMQMISRLYVIFLNANTKCTLLFFLYQCSLQGNAACDIVKSNLGNKFIFCLFCCHPVSPSHAVHSVLYLIVKVCIWNKSLFALSFSTKCNKYDKYTDDIKHRNETTIVFFEISKIC